MIHWNIPKSLLLILTTEYLFLFECLVFIFFKSAKAIKLKRLNLSNVKKFYNDLT